MLRKLTTVTIVVEPVNRPEGFSLCRWWRQTDPVQLLIQGSVWTFSSVSRWRSRLQSYMDFSVVSCSPLRYKIPHFIWNWVKCTLVSSDHIQRRDSRAENASHNLSWTLLPPAVRRRKLQRNDPLVLPEVLSQIQTQQLAFIEMVKKKMK